MFLYLRNHVTFKRQLYVNNDFKCRIKKMSRSVVSNAIIEKKKYVCKSNASIDDSQVNIKVHELWLCNKEKQLLI